MRNDDALLDDSKSQQQNNLQTSSNKVPKWFKSLNKWLAHVFTNEELKIYYKLLQDFNFIETIYFLINVIIQFLNSSWTWKK